MKIFKKYYSLQSFFTYLGRYKLRLAFILVLFTIANIMLALIPVFIGKLVGALAEQNFQASQAYTYAWLLIACSVGHSLSWHSAELVYLKLLNGVTIAYENIVFRQVISQPYPYFVSKFTGKISSYIDTLAKEMRDLTEKIFWDYTNQAVSLVSISLILTIVNWQTGLIFIAGIFSMLVLGKYAIRNSIKYEKIWTDVQSTKNGKIIDAIANFVNVKSFRKETDEILTIENEQRKNIAAANTSLFWAIVFWTVMSFLVRYVIWSATILLNVYLFVHGRIDVTQLTTFLSAVLLFATTIWDLIWNVSQFNLKLARVEEAHTYLFGPVNITDRYLQREEELRHSPIFNSGLSFQDLSFVYPDKPDIPVLSNINLQIKKGEKVGIVGRSGSGKTTLTKLMLDYYEVTEGAIMLDEKPITTKQLASLVSYVPQDTSLFHRTISENIAYAAERKASQGEIETAAKKAHAHEFIVKINESYDALVGERGVKLSAGQRQRIAIARAFLDDKPILILDEATSALDSESEILVQQALEALWEHKTVLAIAHRLSTLRNMDKIVVIENGRVVEEGSHQELLAKKGKYAKLWSHQSGGFLEEE